jgi:SagB-type dehydrogenase family enzyme
MDKQSRGGVLVILAALFLFSSCAFAEELKDIQLLPPRKEGGMPLMQALKERKSTRAYSPEDVSLQDLSNLLWAAYGINRPDSGERTVPSAMNMQEFDIYVLMREGAYIYNARRNVLRPVAAGDLREMTGMQPFVKDAPLDLVYVADYSCLAKVGDQADFYAACDVGFISQNVYLYCASAGLGTIVRGWVDREALGKALNLKPDEKIILVQSAGHPAKKAP